MKNSLKTRVVESALWTGYASIVIVLIDLVQLALISRFLTLEEIGIFSILSIVVGLMTRLNIFSYNSSIIHFSNPNSKELNSLYIYSVGFSIILYFIIFLLAPYLEAYYVKDKLTIWIRIYALLIILNTIGKIFISLYNKDILLKKVARIDIVQKIIVFILFVISIFFLKTDLLLWLILSLLIGASIHALYFFSVGIKHFFAPSLNQLSFKSSRKYLEYNTYELGTSVIGYLSASLDKIFISSFYGMEVLGIYDLAYKLINKPMSYINPILNKVSLPLISEVQDDPISVNKIYLKNIEIISFIQVPLFFGLYLLSQELIPLYYGDGKESTVQVFNILWILGLSKSLANPIGPYLFALGKPNYGFYLNIYRLIIITVLFFIGGRYLQFEETIILFVFGSIFFTIPPNFWARKNITNMAYLDFIKVTMRPFLYSSIMYMVLYVIKNLIFVDNLSVIWELGLLILTGVFIYTLLSYLFNRSFIIGIKKLIIKS